MFSVTLFCALFINVVRGRGLLCVGGLLFKKTKQTPHFSLGEIIQRQKRRKQILDTKQHLDMP